MNLRKYGFWKWKCVCIKWILILIDKGLIFQEILCKKISFVQETIGPNFFIYFESFVDAQTIGRKSLIIL